MDGSDAIGLFPCAEGEKGHHIWTFCECGAQLLVVGGVLSVE